MVNLITDTFKTQATNTSGDPIVGTSLTLECTRTEQGNPNTVSSHRWYKDGSVMDGQTNSDMTLNPLSSPGDNGTYKCLMENSAGWTHLSDATGYSLIVWCEYLPHH